MTEDSGTTISVEDQPGLDVARSAMMLARELTREGVHVSRSAEAVPPVGAKSGVAFAGGSLVISGALSTVAARAAARVIVAFIRRGLAGEITVQNGSRKLIISNASREAERILVDWWVEQSPDIDDAG
jgi:hypothetical protein